MIVASRSGPRSGAAPAGWATSHPETCTARMSGSASTIKTSLSGTARTRVTTHRNGDERTGHSGQYNASIQTGESALPSACDHYISHVLTSKIRNRWVNRSARDRRQIWTRQSRPQFSEPVLGHLSAEGPVLHARNSIREQRLTHLRNDMSPPEGGLPQSNPTASDDHTGR
jgi:hypothetical protein